MSLRTLETWWHAETPEELAVFEIPREKMVSWISSPSDLPPDFSDVSRAAMLVARNISRSGCPTPTEVREQVQSYWRIELGEPARDVARSLGIKVGKVRALHKRGCRRVIREMLQSRLGDELYGGWGRLL